MGNGLAEASPIAFRTLGIRSNHQQLLGIRSRIRNGGRLGGDGSRLGARARVRAHGFRVGTWPSIRTNGFRVGARSYVETRSSGVGTDISALGRGLASGAMPTLGAILTLGPTVPIERAPPRAGQSTCQSASPTTCHQESPFSCIVLRCFGVYLRPVRKDYRSRGATMIEYVSST
jgi:hypothetical protein